MFAQMMRFKDQVPNDFDNRYFGHHPMMWGWGGASGAGFWIWLILSSITWILMVIALVAFIRWLWKKGNKVK